VLACNLYLTAFYFCHLPIGSRGICGGGRRTRELSSSSFCDWATGGRVVLNSDGV